MKNFTQYYEVRQLSEILETYNINVDEFCDTILTLAEQNKLNEDNLCEAGWIQNAARGLSGLGNMFASPFKKGYNAASNIAQQGYNAASNMTNQALNAGGKYANQAFNSMGNAVNNIQNKTAGAVNAVGGAIKGAANTAGNAVNSLQQDFQRGSDLQSSKQVLDRLSGVYNALKSMGYGDVNLKNLTFGTVEKAMQRWQQIHQNGKNPRDIVAANKAKKAQQALVNQQYA